MTYPDYYGDLGVEENADLAEIKRAYREKAKLFHPDVSRHDDAEDRFKRMQAAYEVLSDPVRRAEYDAQRRAALRRKQASASRASAPKGHSWQGFPFGEVFRAFSFLGDWDEFDGDLLDDSIQAQIELTPDEAAQGAEVTLQVPIEVACESCNATGLSGLDICPECDGEGILESFAQLTLRIPAGVADGDRLVFPVHLSERFQERLTVEVCVAPPWR